MKKLIVGLLVSALLAPTHSEAAVVKPCPKSKLNKIQNGMVCKKVGVLYRWVAIPKPTATPKPTTTAKPTSTPTPTPTSTPKPEDFKETTYNKVIKIYESKQASSFELKVVSHSSVSSNSIKNIISRYELVTKFWQSELKTKKILIIIGSNDDILWVKNQLELAFPFRFDDWYNNFSKNMPAQRCNTYSAGSYGLNPQGYLVQSFNLYSATCPTQEPTDNNYRTTVEHELTHAMQSSLTNNSINLLPCWFKEGQASYYGAVLGNSNNFLRFLESRNYVVQNQPLSSIKDVMIKLDEKYDNFKCGTDGGYSYGILAIEQLIKAYSNEDVHSFIENTGTTRNWRLSFLNIFKIDFNDWVSMLDSGILNQ